MPVLSTEQMYDVAHTHVSTWEKDINEFTNHPNDPGGPTRNGVSLKYLNELGIKYGDLNKDGKIDINDVKMVDLDIAKNLFRKSFWVDAKAELLPPLTSIVYYDFAVNSGAGRAAIVLQESIDVLLPGTIVSYAGNIGPKTQNAVEILFRAGKDYDLAKEYLTCREQFYRGLVNGNPSRYGVFLKGWINRVDVCELMINEIHNNGVTPKLYENIRRKYVL